MSTTAPDPTQANENNASKLPRMTFLGLPVETAAWWAEFALISGGIAVALLAALVSNLNGRVSMIEALRSDALIAEAGKNAATARKDAADSTERSKLHEIKIGELSVESAAQRERAATAERALLELQGRLAWRTLTPEQESILVARLSQFKGQSMVLFSIAGLAEVNRYTDQIEAALEKAGLVVERRDGAKMGQYQGSNITLEVHESRAALANAVRPALRTAGMTDGDAPLWISLIPNDFSFVVWPK
jgi:hypothetical protein